MHTDKEKTSMSKENLIKVKNVCCCLFFSYATYACMIGVGGKDKLVMGTVSYIHAFFIFERFPPPLLMFFFSVDVYLFL